MQPLDTQAERAVIVDDDPEIRALHRQVLDQVGLQCVVTTNSIDGIEAVRTFTPVLTLLDVSMPGMDGFAAARRIREFSDTHLLMVTALDDEIDLVQGLDAGADDYVSKPYRPRELRARVEAVLRRHRRRGATSTVNFAEVPSTEPGLWTAETSDPPAPAETSDTVPRTAGTAALAVVPELGSTVTHGSLSLAPGTGVASADGVTVPLEPEEAAILAALIDSGHRVRSTANLVLALRGESYVTTYFVDDTDKHAVREHVENLRRRLGDTDPTPKWIESVGGIGYRMTST